MLVAIVMLCPMTMDATVYDMHVYVLVSSMRWSAHGVKKQSAKRCSAFLSQKLEIFYRCRRRCGLQPFCAALCWLVRRLGGCGSESSRMRCSLRVRRKGKCNGYFEENRNACPIEGWMNVATNVYTGLDVRLPSTAVEPGGRDACTTVILSRPSRSR